MFYRLECVGCEKKHPIETDKTLFFNDFVLSLHR